MPANDPIPSPSVIWPLKQWRDGEPCNHAGCLSHISHPCEGCGRIGGLWPSIIRPTPSDAVREARKIVAAWMDVDDGEYVLVLDTLIAAAQAEGRAEAVLEWSARIRREHRAEALREVREKVAGVERLNLPERDWVTRADVFAAIDAMAGAPKADVPPERARGCPTRVVEGSANA